MAKAKKVLAAVGEPDVMPAPTPAPIQDEPVLPWLDCDGNELHEGDKATVLPDVSKRLSGKLVQVLGDYDPQKKSVQVAPEGWEGEPFGILLCYLKRLPVLGENLEEPLDPYKLPHYTEVRAEQDQERTARRQEPVAPFALAGQAAHEAAQAAPEPHPVGWATKEGSQMNHHYDAQGATACGYKRKAGQLAFAAEPDKLPRWQRCEKCDVQLAPPAPAAEPEMSIAAWNLLERTVRDGELLAHAKDFTQGAELNELQAAGLVELLPFANGSTYKPTAAGIAEINGELTESAPVANSAAKQKLTPDHFTGLLDTAAAGLRVVPLASIVVTTNTRKVFDEAALAELAQSMKEHGILQPVMLRPHPTEAGQYELVAGGRRYRAAQLAGLTEVPATVRTLTDREFLEVQLLENLQRVDVRPADEATAFAKLLGSNFSAEEIGLKVGKPVKFVLQRAKLVALIPFWMELLEADRLPLVAAHELARLPAHSQVVVKKWIEGSRGYMLKNNDVLSASDIRHAINQEVLRKLDLVAFPKEDATLCPAAGACTTCPKNSANSRGLFDDLTDSSRQAICLDSSCFSRKKEAFMKRRIREVEQQLGGLPVLVADETQTRKQYPTAIYAYQFYNGKEGNPGVVQALKLDGTEAGQLVWGALSSSAQSHLGKDSDAKKAEDAARIRRERTRKTHRTLLAEALTTDLPDAIEQESAAAHAALDYFILEELSGKATTKVDYLKSALGWEPTEAALKDDYNTRDALGFRPWKSWLVGKLDEVDFTEKLRLFFILKVRHRMDHEYEDLQFDIAKLAGETYDHVAGQAEQAVEERYYTRKGKKQEVAA